MNVEQLEYYLDRGNNFGLNINVNDPNYISWVLLNKRKPINNFFDLFDEGDNPVLYKEQLSIVEKPYNLWIAELRKEVYEKDLDLNNEDYRVNYIYSSASNYAGEGGMEVDFID